MYLISTAVRTSWTTLTPTQRAAGSMAGLEPGLEPGPVPEEVLEVCPAWEAIPMATSTGAEKLQVPERRNNHYFVRQMGEFVFEDMEEAPAGERDVDVSGSTCLEA